MGYRYAGLTHCLNCARRVTGLQVDPTACIHNQDRSKPSLDAVERREFDAIIGCQAAQKNSVDIAIPQVISQTGRTLLSVVEETAVAVDLGVCPLSEDFGKIFCAKSSWEICTEGLLNAVHGPQDLSDPVQFDYFARHPVRMIDGEAAVVPRMPVLRGENEIVFARDGVDHRDYLIAIGNR